MLERLKASEEATIVTLMAIFLRRIFSRRLIVLSRSGMRFLLSMRVAVLLFRIPVMLFLRLLVLVR